MERAKQTKKYLFWSSIREVEKIQRISPFRFDIHTRFRAVSYAKGVRRVVAFGDAPVPVDEEIIAGIQARLTKGCVTLPSVSLKPGLKSRCLRCLPSRCRRVWKWSH